MEISEKVAYLKGLAEGLALDTDTKEGKLIAAIIDVLDDMSEKFVDLEDELCDVEDGLDAVSDDLCEVEEALYELEDDDDEYDDYDEDEDYEDDEDDDDQNEYDFGSETLYEVKCPTCGEVITIDEEMLDEGATTCPNCGEELEFDMEDEDSEEDE